MWCFSCFSSKNRYISSCPNVAVSGYNIWKSKTRLGPIAGSGEEEPGVFRLQKLDFGVNLLYTIGHYRLNPFIFSATELFDFVLQEGSRGLQRHLCSVFYSEYL